MPFVPLPPYSGTPPARGQQRANFNTNMEYAFEYMADMPYYINATGASIEALVDEAEQAVTDATNAGSAQVALAEAQATIAQGHAADAQNSAAMAAAAANNHGDWSLLSGAFPAGEAVIHDGAVWISLDAIADVATSEPGVSADWFNYSDSVEGLSNPMNTEGDIIVGGAAGAPTRVAKGANNTVWGVDNSGILGYQTGFCGYGNAILLNNTNDLNTVTPLRNNARFAWYAGSVPANVPPGFAAAYMDMFGAGSGHQSRKQIIYDRDSNNVIMRRTGDAGATWTEQVIGTVTEAPIDGSKYVRKDGAWETIGAITGSGITMTTARMLGRTTAGTGAIEQLTGAQVRSFAGAAAAGAVASSGLTSATARIIGRTTAGGGPLEELTAANVLSFLGISTGSFTTTAVNWVGAGSTVRLVKIGSIVIATVYVGMGNSTSTATTTYSAAIPSEFRPSSQSDLYMPVVSSPYDVQAWGIHARFETSGNLVFSRTTGDDSSTFHAHGTIQWQV